jgi:RNA polymerase sigma factor (sigma-70 family)
MDFPVTIWTLIHQAHLNGNTAARSALETFCEQYRQPVIQFLRQRRVLENRVEDMAHDFLLHLMENDALRRADPARGRFRTYLLAALRNFMASDIVHQNADKRGGGAEHLSIDLPDVADFLADPTDPEVNSHDQAWAVNLITVSYQALEQELIAKGKAERLKVLKSFVLPGRQPPSMPEVAQELNLDEGAVRTEISRYRKRLRELFRAEVARTVVSDTEIEDEIHYLQQVLTNPRVPMPEA